MTFQPATRQSAAHDPVALDSGEDLGTPVVQSSVEPAPADARLLELRREIREACRGETRWEARVVAAIEAMLGFCASRPVEARALASNAAPRGGARRNPEQILISFLAAELDLVAPRSRRVPIPSDESVIASMAAIVRGRLFSGDRDELLACAPDLVCLALLPYLEFSQMAGWAESASRQGSGAPTC